MLTHRAQFFLICRVLDAAQQERAELLQRFLSRAAAGLQRAEDREQADGVVALAGLNHRPDCALRGTELTVTCIEGGHLHGAATSWSTWTQFWCSASLKLTQSCLRPV